MSVTIHSLVQLGRNSWRLTYSSSIDGATFRIYIDGEFRGSTRAGAYTFDSADEAYPLIEVLDDDTSQPAAARPARMILGWNGADAAVAEYRIEEFVGAAWVVRKRMINDGQSWFHFVTRPLEDVTTHQFRVIPVGVNGNDGTSRSFVVFMVRHPDPPSVSYTFSAGTKRVTIASA